MRIAFLNWTRQRVGGAEATMSAVLVGLARQGHEIALGYELTSTDEGRRHELPRVYPSWCLQELGFQPTIAAVREWKPDVLFVHGLRDPRFERAALAIGPAVFFAHTYSGTCISGTKTLTFPHVRPCPYTFGWPCLLRYYPRRTGGLSPLTMLREYRRQARRLATLREYRLIVVLSEHIRAEYLRHGFVAERVVRLPFPPVFAPSATPKPCRPGSPQPGDAWRLLFAGRMDPLKGGAVLLAALPKVAKLLGAPVALTFVGDGPARRGWEAQAAFLTSRHSNVRVQFCGWVGEQELQTYYRGADLIVLPSLWPEPFGLIGLEAGAHGLPCAAFAVGGIPEWLTEGINGTLAPGDSPTAAGIANAIARALEDPDRYAALRSGALEVARRATAERYMPALVAALELARGPA